MILPVENAAGIVGRQFVCLPDMYARVPAYSPCLQAMRQTGAAHDVPAYQDANGYPSSGIGDSTSAVFLARYIHADASSLYMPYTSFFLMQSEYRASD